jgi:hypothetical protein
VLKFVGFEVARGGQSSFHHFLGRTTTDDADSLSVGLLLDNILGLYTESDVIIARPTELINLAYKFTSLAFTVGFPNIN